MSINNEQSEIQVWLSDINPSLVLNNGVCNFEEPRLEVEVGISVNEDNNLITFCSPMITINADNKILLLEKAMLTNSDGNKMDGCWLSLIDNEVLLSHVREIDTLDQISLANIIDNFTFKSYEIKKEFSIQFDFNKPIENILTNGLLV